MTRDTKNLVLRVGILVALVGAIAVALFWRTARDLEEVSPGVLYRTAIASNDDFISVALKLEPHGIVAIGSVEEQHAPMLAAVHDYGFKNHLRVWEFIVPPGKTPTTSEMDRLRELLNKQRNPAAPALLVAPDPIRGGMVAAAYRLDDMKMPLSEVEKLAGTQSKDPQAVEAIRAFARQWAKAPIPPATQPAEGTGGSNVPAGPALPQ